MTKKKDWEFEATIHWWAWILVTTIILLALGGVGYFVFFSELGWFSKTTFFMSVLFSGLGYVSGYNKAVWDFYGTLTSSINLRS